MNDSTKNAPAATATPEAAAATPVVSTPVASEESKTDATGKTNISPIETRESAPSVAAVGVKAVAVEKAKITVDAKDALDGQDAVNQQNDVDRKGALDEKQQRAASAEWRVVGETIQGASHIRAQLPNQDAILQLRASSISLPIVLSISDGHGSDKCFRSDRGSHFAVHLAATLLNETLDRAKNSRDVQKFEEAARQRLPAELVKRWRASVEADLRREPLREEEFARLIEKDGAPARKLVEANPYLAYGATLLAVALTSSFALYMQLGDGEILTVSDAGEVLPPLPKDERLLANETTSLCLERAADDFRFRVQPHNDSPPALILLTTDGYANSFSTTDGFHQVGTDIISMMRADGFDYVNRNVKSWLEEATRAGSGDDCTLALIVRMDALNANSSMANASSSSIPSSNTAASPVVVTTEAADKNASADSHEQPATPKTA